MCIVTKRDVTETILVVVIFLTSLSETIQEKECLTVFVGGLMSSVYCISSRTVYTEGTVQQPQGGSGARLLLGRKVEYLVVHRVPREWVLLENFHNTNDK